MSASTTRSFNVVRLHCRERLAAILCWYSCRIRMSAPHPLTKMCQFLFLCFTLTHATNSDVKALCFCVWWNVIYMLLYTVILGRLFLTGKKEHNLKILCKCTYIFNILRFLKQIKHNDVGRISWKVRTNYQIVLSWQFYFSVFKLCIMYYWIATLCHEVISLIPQTCIYSLSDHGCLTRICTGKM